MRASWVRVDFQPAQAAPMNDQQPYRMLIRHSIARLASGASYRLRFDQVGDVFPPGMVGNDIHPGAPSDLRAFAEDVGCTVTKADKLKIFVFRKRLGRPGD